MSGALHPRQVLWIAGMPRSGTSWLAQILASHPETRLKLCPLFSYAFKNALNEDSSREDWEKFFAEVYSRPDDYMDQAFLRREGLVPEFALKSATPPLLVIKSNRFHHLLPRMLELGVGASFLFLVRDPRAAIASWLNNPREFPGDRDPMTEWRSGACRKTAAGEFWGFDDWKLTAQLHLDLSTQYPGQARILRYEELTDAPAKVAAELLNRCGLDLHPQTAAFIEDSTRRHSANPRSVFKDPQQLRSRPVLLPAEICSAIRSEVRDTPLERFLDPDFGPAPVAADGGKRRVEDLAIFGGPRLFDTPRPTGQLYAPDRSVFLSRLREILDRRRFSNGGPLQTELEERLAERHGVRHVVAFANASLALIALLRQFSRRDRPDVLLPSFSYRGLPHLIQWAGKRPWFCDVDPETHTLSRASVERAAGSSQGVAAILAVNHVNAPADIAGLEALGRELDAPVIYDSVYAICARFEGRPFGGAGIAEVFSLHATKMINGFEGGYVTTNDDAVASALTAVRNFGYEAGNPHIAYLGMNGKLNEIHAAMALGSLEQADDLLRMNTAVFEAYRTCLADIDGLAVIEPHEAVASNHEMVLVRISPDAGIGRDAMLDVLQAENALARPYFSPPLHLSAHCPADVKPGRLPVSEELAQRYIQLPTGRFLGPDDPERLAGLLRFLMRRGPEITARLAQGQGAEA